MKRIQRVLCAADLARATTSLARVEALEELGLAVSRLDTTGICKHRWRPLNFLGHRVFCTPAIFATNRLLRERLRRERPEVLWIDKARWVFPGALRLARALGTRVVHYNTDDLYGTEEFFWLHRRGLRHFDVTITTNRFNVAEIPRRFGRPAFRAGMGYDHRELRAQTVDTSSPRCDLVFVGHYEPHTEEFVGAAAEAGFSVEVFGGQWGRARREQFRTVQRLPQEDYAAKIQGARFALCSLSRRNRNESTGRSFEIPALGGLLLAEDTAEHRWLYRDGIDAVFFREANDLVKRMKDLRDDAARLAGIRASGQQRCQTLGLSWLDHLRREWRICERLLETGRLELTPADDEPFWPGFRAGLAYRTEGKGA